MIKFDEKTKQFHLSGNHFSYIMRVLPTGHFSHVYYGPHINSVEDSSILTSKHNIEVGSQVIYDQNDRTFNLNLAQLELSTYGKGDFRDPMFHFRLPDGSRITDFHYVGHEILNEKPSFEEMPETFGKEDDCQSLMVTLYDEIAKIQIDLYYSVFDKIDILTRRAVITNKNDEKIMIEKALSVQVDFDEHAFDMMTLDGAWIRERHIHHRDLTYGIVKIDSKRGVSSSDHNPFVGLIRKNTNEEQGECYGFSLIYSGNFEASSEVNPHGMLRFMMGINSFDFYWNLGSNQSFVTPEAVLTYSNQGLSKLSQNFHELVNKHIVSPNWQGKERPILINNWEATYFDFNEKKLLKLAKKAKSLGIELFVLDDGWFGKRNNDQSSLGDWFVNTKKLPSGISGLAQKINKIGLDFGIWVEPEMVNPDSELYRLHPEWAITHPLRNASLGRNQLVLDLSREDVRSYLFKVLSDLFENANINYCKWDMNRSFSDIFSQNLSSENQGELSHRYVLGLYQLLSDLTKKFPHILFESCASGGNRFDLGMLYYMPQTWTSDNTDGIERIKIQYGTSMVYPPSTMGAHVSHSPNAQTLRNTPIETRFNTAAFGLLGYELDLTKLSIFELKCIKNQIAYYKEHRQLFQFGTLYRNQNPYESNQCRWMMINDEQNEGLVGIYQFLSEPNGSTEKIKIKGLESQGIYQIKNRSQFMNLKLFGDLIKHALPIKISANSALFNFLSNRYMMPIEVDNLSIPGDVLLANGFIPKQPFIGTGYNAEIRLMGDFGSRIYHIKRKENEQ
ncbi:MAG: alpha-galactosidase [Tenericutes bacterium HGW-Tenericutes-1]|jgi:alpha-galactosidase|nr:MAG: alpha-galactosidase [Tenericutes bacterium HGW-Tenericutes-1]